MAGPIISAVALDLGTTSIKAALLDQNGKLSNTNALNTPEIITNNGSFESDALHYVETAELVLAKCLAQVGSNLPLGLCSQRSSFLVWERASGQPITSLISWQDNRGIASCEALRNSENIIHNLTGLRLTPYYFAPKLNVLLQLNPEWRDRLINGELMVGTLDSFLIWRWTNGELHITDASMAARTLLMDLKKQAWSSILCQHFGIPLFILPKIMPSTGLNLSLKNGLALQANVADQSAALIAGICEDKAKALVNLGTGGFVMRYQAREEGAMAGYLQTLVYMEQVGYGHIADEGTINSISAALASFPVDQCRVEDLALSDIYCLAEPSGIGAPYFRNDLGTYFSRPIDHLTKNQIAILLLEAIIFRVARILEDFHRVSPIAHVYLSGGLSRLGCLQQGIAACVPHKVSCLQQQESSLHGVAMLTAGMLEKRCPEANMIVIKDQNNVLNVKYQYWKDWLDRLLEI